MSAVASDQTSEPLVTIAIPTFNRASWLKDCVLSAFSQSYLRLEILVSDNASTDNTPQVLREFKDTRLRIVRQKTNIGLLGNWNACLASAKGDYIVFVSDDDRIEPWLLERCIGLVKTQPKIPIVLTLCATNSASQGRTWLDKSLHLETGIWDGTEILLEYLRHRISVHMCSIMLRTEDLRAQGGFRPDFPHLADVAAWAPLLFKGKAGLVNEACATCYSHSANETSRLGIEQLLADGWKVAELICNLADHSVDDVRTRRAIQLQSKNACFRRGIIILDLYRNEEGNSLLEVLSVVWRFRHIFLANSNLQNLVSVRWHIARILCAKQIAWIHRLRKRYRNQLA